MRAFQLVFGGTIDAELRSVVTALLANEFQASDKAGSCIASIAEEMAEDFVDRCECAAVDLAVVVFNPVLRTHSGVVGDASGFVAALRDKLGCPIIVMANGVRYGVKDEYIFRKAGACALLGFPFSRGDFHEALVSAGLVADSV
jgi:hypothetical protein